MLYVLRSPLKETLKIAKEMLWMKEMKKSPGFEPSTGQLDSLKFEFGKYTTCFFI